MELTAIHILYDILSAVDTEEKVIIPHPFVYFVSWSLIIPAFDISPLNCLKCF